MNKVSLLILSSIIVAAPLRATSQTSRGSQRRSTSAAKAAAEKSSAELKAGRERVAAQIKTLTHFLYLFGSISKGIELAEANPEGVSSPAIAQQNQSNKTKVRESIKSVREGLEKLETDFSASPTLRNYHGYILGIADLGQAAQDQAAANRFSDVARSLLKAVDQLTDALTALGAGR